ncbi:MAG: hypothetical protein JXB49_04760 [Bacteroidales bacterium]|nr:hypothetical protein [Bacteroidales bacterium]
MANEYGEKKAKLILAASELMHAGNIYGIPYSAFISRLKGRPYKDSSFIYELGMQIAGFILLPFALIHGFIKILFGFTDVKLDNNESIEQTHAGN